MFAKFKGLTIKQKVLAIGCMTPALGAVVWMIDYFGYEKVQKGLDVLIKAADAF